MKTFARRARSSSKAILTAVALSLAAIIALYIAAQRHETAQEIPVFGPVSALPVMNVSEDVTVMPEIAH